jgi:hypothetical protein
MRATNAVFFHLHHFPILSHPPDPKLFAVCGKPKSYNIESESSLFNGSVIPGV